MTQLRKIMDKYLLSTDEMCSKNKEYAVLKSITHSIKISLKVATSDSDLYKQLADRLKCTDEILEAYKTENRIKAKIDNLISMLLAYETICHIRLSRTAKIFLPIMRLNHVGTRKIFFFDATKMKKPLFVDKLLFEELEALKAGAKIRRKQTHKPHYEEIAGKLNTCLAKFKVLNRKDAPFLIQQIFGIQFYERVKVMLSFGQESSFEDGNLLNPSIQKDERRENTSMPTENNLIMGNGVLTDPRVDKNDYAQKTIAPPSESKFANKLKQKLYLSGWNPLRSSILQNWPTTVMAVNPEDSNTTISQDLRIN